MLVTKPTFISAPVANRGISLRIVINVAPKIARGCAHAADDDHGDKFDRQAQVERLGCDAHHIVGPDGAGKTCIEGAGKRQEVCI